MDSLGIIGAGTMGRGIASVSAMNGLSTVLYDIEGKILENAKDTVSDDYGKMESEQKITAKDKHDVLSRINFTDKFDHLLDCEFIIEAATENIDIKRDIFSRLDGLTSPDTILATNTSSLSVTAISSAVRKDRSRIAGMHFFNPANIMKLVEVVRGEFSSDKTIERTVELGNRLGKTPVICKDTPAFIVNRIARPFYGEAMKILESGKMPVNEIDVIMKEEGGFKLGPFELMDLIGIDINYSVTESVYKAFYNDPKYKPSPIQRKMVQSGLLGRKTGVGFYRYG